MITKEILPTTALPRHVAIIMDGNGRWAQERGLTRAEGHRVGAEVVNRIVKTCRRVGIKHLTLYAFSEQNWGRPAVEVNALMTLLLDYLKAQRAEIIERRIRLRALGEIGKLPIWVRGPLQALIKESESAQGMTLNLALSYGGREELVRAMQLIAKKVQDGLLLPDQIDDALVQAHLYAPDLPPADLIIRTSGEQRLSNFLLWQSAYAELDFLEMAWPDFDETALLSSLRRFAERERRFGLTSAQLDERVHTLKG